MLEKFSVYCSSFDVFLDDVNVSACKCRSNDGHGDIAVLLIDNDSGRERPHHHHIYEEEKECWLFVCIFHLLAILVVLQHREYLWSVHEYTPPLQYVILSIRLEEVAK